MGVTRVLVLDSYDSFVYNLVQYLGELGAEPIVYRNDDLTLEEALALDVDGVLLSPGPGRPEDAGIICEAIVPSSDWPCFRWRCHSRSRADAWQDK